MNKYCINDVLSNQLASYRTTLQQASYDDKNQVYLCSNRQLTDVYDFDAYVRDKYDRSNLPASPDAIYVGHKKVYFIEFKNQYMRDIDPSNIKNKFRKGTMILSEGLLANFSPRDIEYIFCVVSKDQRQTSAVYFDSSHIEDNIIRFGLDDENQTLGGFYSTIITQPLSFYKEGFKEISCPE